MADVILRVEHLTKHYSVVGSFLGRLLSRQAAMVRAVEDVSLDLERGEIFGLVGESGCGKTTLGRTILRLTEPTSGKVIFDGQDITHLPESDLRPIRRRMQIVFQDPHASLNPAMTVGRAVADPMRIHNLAESEESERKEVLNVLHEVGLEPAEEMYDRYPADLSGGQKQRVVIARALILRPSFVVADEAVAMLDMSVRAKILELLLDLKRKYGLTYLFITHDLATAKFLCHRLAIMYLGKIVEMGDAKEVYEEPWHPYTRALLSAIPIPDPKRRRLKEVPGGEVPDAIYPPQGCRFHPRCPKAFAACGWEPQDLMDLLELEMMESSLAQVVGPLKDISIAGDALVVPVKERSGDEVAEALRSVLKGNSAMAESVRSLDILDREVRVAFEEPLEPRDIELEGRQVKCHLFDPQVEGPEESLPFPPQEEYQGRRSKSID